MITGIGLVTMTAMIWVLIDSLSRESDAERRRDRMQAKEDRPPGPPESHEPIEKAA